MNITPAELPAPKFTLQVGQVEEVHVLGMLVFLCEQER
jgi:hypothetical protein